MVEHSPLPWRRMKDDNYAWIIDSENYLVVRTDNHANRDLIMRAVNAHADFVDVCKAILAESSPSWSLYEPLRAALAKAGESCD